MEVNQSYVQWGHLSVRRADPEFAAIRAMNSHSSAGGILCRAWWIRFESSRGWPTPSIRSLWVGTNSPGFFSAELQTNIATTAQALKSLLTVIESMQQTPVTPEESSDMKRYYEGSLSPGGPRTF